MPGIIGCLTSSGTKKEVQNASQALRYASWYKEEAMFEDNLVICTQVHLGNRRKSNQQNKNLCWVEGEFYNIDSLKKQFGLAGETAENILIAAYEKNILPELLSVIDGCYVAVLYDEVSAQIKLISDRFGLKPLYIWVEGNDLAWSSELKGFFSFHQFSKKINQEGLQCFLKNGHFLGQTTWFEKVSYVNASTILTYSIAEKRITQSFRYWSWSKIKSLDLSFERAVEEAGLLFKKAVSLRSEPADQKYGLSLSGGLDSRAILAAVSKELPALETFTFGTSGSDDVLLSRKVSDIANRKHHFYKLSADNWLKGRIESIWKSDGSLNFIHFHGSQFHEAIAKHGHILFNGFAGDLILGGSWLDHPDTRISSEHANQKFHDFSHLDDPTDEFFEIEKEDASYINNRVRRFTANGLNEIKHFESRIPFFDNQLIEFIYGLPDEFRQDNRLYTELLLKYFPKYFKSIPRQGSGYPIGDHQKWRHAPKRFSKLLLRKFGVDKINFAPYNKWMIKDQMILKKVLCSEQAILPEFLDHDYREEVNLFEDTLKIGRLFTIEVWLQQVFNHKFLTTEELIRFGQ